MIGRRLRLARIGMVCLFSIAAWPLAQSSAEEKARVLAKLGEQAITDRDVDFQLGRIASESIEPLPPLPTAILQATISLIAQQRQALQTLRIRKQAVGREDVERWLVENGQPKNGGALVASEIIRQQAEKAGISESNLRDHLTFRLSWQRYLQQQLSEKNVQKHFENETQRFDGTRFRISIVDVAVAAGKSDRRDKVVELLGGLRGRLVSGDLVWKDLAEELDRSMLASKPRQFRVREEMWARGTGDLEPTVITAVMELELEGICKPIHTPTGVHMLKLHGIEAGQRSLSEVRDEVRQHMLLHLLEHLARQSESQLPLQAVE